MADPPSAAYICRRISLSARRGWAVGTAASSIGLAGAFVTERARLRSCTVGMARLLRPQPGLSPDRRFVLVRLEIGALGCAFHALVFCAAARSAGGRSPIKDWDAD
jgi:hypothetical protein